MTSTSPHGARPGVASPDRLSRRRLDPRPLLGGRRHGPNEEADHAIAVCTPTTPRTLLVLPDGRALNERALAELRALESGHACLEELLERPGAPPRRGGDPTAWLRAALTAAGVRRLHRPGDHRYLFRVGDRGARWPIAVGLAGRPHPTRAAGRAEGRSSVPHGPGIPARRGVRRGAQAGGCAGPPPPRR